MKKIDAQNYSAFTNAIPKHSPMKKSPIARWVSKYCGFGSRGKSVKAKWISDEECLISDTSFFMAVDLETIHAVNTSDDRFLLVKNRPLVENIFNRADPKLAKNIVEIGIFKGGSIALYALVYKPTRLVGIEYATKRVEALDNFIAKRGIAESVRLHYGVDQSDRARVRNIIEEEFGGEALDLVVDDGSHHYEKTKSSFETIFPYLRQGGVFVVEDWGWAHWAGPIWQECQAFPAQDPSMTNLLLEVCMLAASRPDIVSHVEVEPSLFRVTRGGGEVEPGFSLGDFYLNRGKPFVPVM